MGDSDKVGGDLHRHGRPDPDRMPLAHETSMPGVFAIGDTRLGSVKRVATAVGDGAGVVQLLHGYLAQVQEPTAAATGMA